MRYPFKGLVEHGFRVLEFQVRRLRCFFRQRSLIADANFHYSAEQNALPAGK